MKKRSLIISICSTLFMTLWMHVLFSCASKEPVEGEELSDSDSSELISEEASSQELANEKASANEKEPEDAKEDLAELEATVGDEEKTAELDATVSNEKTTTEAGTAANEQELAAASANTPENAPETPEPPLEVSPEIALAPTLSPPDSEVLVPSETTTPADDNAKTPVFAPPDTASSLMATPPAASTANSAVPKIPGKAIVKDGKKLNRFYFVRKGDTPAKISRLIYGNEAQAKLLSKWNRGNWAPGKILYYASPTQPEDDKVGSFYQEHSIPVESYEIGKKDSLSTVARKKLGAAGSWKEIAVLNGLETKNAIEFGQKIEINPFDLAAAALASSKINTIAGKKGAPSSTPDQGSEPGPGGTNPALNASNELPPIVEPPPLPDPKDIQPTPAVKSGDSELDIGNLIGQNLFPIVIGGLILGLLAMLLLVGKRKKKKDLSDEFHEDGFSAPPKLKKRK